MDAGEIEALLASDTEPVMHAPVAVGTHDSVRGRARALPGLRALAFAVALAASASVGWATGGATDVGTWLRSLFELYVDAQLTMLEASGNLNPAGEAEYAIVLREPLDELALRDLAEAHAGARYLRRTLFDGAVVFAVRPGDRQALDALRADRRVSVVVPNRGLWICH